MSAAIRRMPGSAMKFRLDANCERSVSRPLMPSPRIPLLASYLAFFFLATALFAAGRASAQVCPQGGVNEADLIAKIAQAGNQFAQFRLNDPNHSSPGPDRTVIYRLAAIGGNALIPALRRISKPDMPENDMPGAAQRLESRQLDRRTRRVLHPTRGRPRSRSRTFIPL
jgi:hypothetical protein